MMMDAEELLRTLGLTPTECRVYLALLDEPNARVTALAQAAGVSRPRAYDVVRVLVARGIVRERPGLFKRFEAVPLEAVAALIVQRERARVEALASAVARFLAAGQGAASAVVAPAPRGAEAGSGA